MIISPIISSIVEPILKPIIGQVVPAFTFEAITAAADTFQLPLEATGTYDFHVDWGDGSSSDITVWDHADTNHSYAGAGTYVVKITGTIVGWDFQNGAGLGVDKDLIHDISSWGPLLIGSGAANFQACSNLTVSATDPLDLTGLTSLLGFFKTCTSLVSVDFSAWDTSNITVFQTTFDACSSLIEAVVQDWDITSATNALAMFRGATLSTANYDALILSWSAQAQTIVANFSGGNSTYTGGGAVEAARDAWVAKGWVITDGGIAP